MRVIAPLLIGLFLFCILSTGCMTTGIGDIVYRGSAFEVRIEEDILPEEVTIQINIFRIEGLYQEKELLVIERKRITPGDDILLIAAPLSEGIYKAHMIIFYESTRIAGRIIDFTV